MPTPILTPQAAAWASYTDTHTELLPAITKRAGAVRLGYRVAQIGFIVLLANSQIIANAAVGQPHALHNLGPAGLPLVGAAGWLGLKALASLHGAWREVSWGFSASSLQKIYKAQPDSYDQQQQLRCINCRQTLQAQSSNDTRFMAPVCTHGASCPNCGFKLWPGCSSLAALLENARGSL